MIIDDSKYLERAEKLCEFIVKLTLGLCRERTVNYSPKDYSGDGPDGMPAPGMESRVIASAFTAIKLLKEDEAEIPGKVVFGAIADEEIEVSQLVSFTGRLAALAHAVASRKRPVRAAGREESRR